MEKRIHEKYHDFQWEIMVRPFKPNKEYSSPYESIWAVPESMYD